MLILFSKLIVHILLLTISSRNFTNQPNVDHSLGAGQQWYTAGWLCQDQLISVDSVIQHGANLGYSPFGSIRSPILGIGFSTVVIQNCGHVPHSVFRKITLRLKITGGFTIISRGPHLGRTGGVNNWGGENLLAPREFFRAFLGRYSKNFGPGCQGKGPGLGPDKLKSPLGGKTVCFGHVGIKTSRGV